MGVDYVCNAAPGGTVTVHQPFYRDARFNGLRVGLLATLCQRVYDIVEDENILGDPSWTAPPGWRVDDMFHRKSTGALAALYTNGPDWVLVFRGSDLPQHASRKLWDELKHDLATDWFGDDVPQGVGEETPQYDWAMGLALDVIEDHLQDPSRRTLTFAGHSLGGGLAATASFVTGVVPTITFNAAAVHGYTRKRAYENRPNRNYSAKHIDIHGRTMGEMDRIVGYRVDGEVVSEVERWAHKNGVLSRFVSVPTSTGALIVLPVSTTDATKLFGLEVPQAAMRHMMDVVQRSLALPDPEGCH